MQRFIVPQFIEEENKIFGPVTVRQFVISMIIIVVMVIILVVPLIQLRFIIVYLPKRNSLLMHK